MAVVVPTQTFAAGTYAFGPFNVQQGLTKVQVVFDKSAWTDPAVTLDMHVDISFDNGQTWNSPHPDVDPFPVGFTAEGGGLDKFGNPYLAATLATSLPGPTVNQRRLRVNAVIAGGSLTTSVSINLS